MDGFPKFKEDTTHIKNLEDLINGHVKGNVIKHEVAPLTSVGENFGSEILKVDIEVEEDEQRKEIHGVAKLIPPTEMQLKIFNSQVTFKNEIGFYADIVPAIKEFQKEHGLEPANYFPDFYGGRTSLDPSKGVVDNDAVLLLENLKITGFATGNRSQGFDLETTKLILKVLADLQATTVAIKIKKPEIFNDKIKPYLVEWKTDSPRVDLDAVIKENPATAPHLSKVKKCLTKKYFRKIREPWATITHNDAWINNIMIKHENEKAVEIKLVDFQVIDLASPARDVLFFLLDNVTVSVLRYHFDKLLKFYHSNFIEVLEKLKLKNIKEFSYETFLEELRLEAPYQIMHALFMLPVIIGIPDMIAKRPGKIAEWNPNNGWHDSALIPASQKPDMGHGFPEISYPLVAKERIWFMVEEAVKRNWI